MLPKTLPNWIDVVVVTLVVRACYTGFGRGLVAELLNLVGIVSATSLACNFHNVLARALSPWWYGDPAHLEFLVFFILLLSGVLVVRMVLRRLSDVIKWERLHWAIQGLGFVVGGLRGVWWAGLVLLMMLATGLPFFTRGIEDRSMLSPRLVKVARKAITWTANRYPGHAGRTVFIPQITVVLPSLP